MKFRDHPTTFPGMTTRVSSGNDLSREYRPVWLERSNMFLGVVYFIIKKSLAKSRHNPSRLFHDLDINDPRHHLTRPYPENGPIQHENQSYELEALPCVLEKSHVKFRDNTTTLCRFFNKSCPCTSRHVLPRKTGRVGLGTSKIFLKVHYNMLEKAHAKFHPDRTFLGMFSEIMIIQEINVCSCHFGKL